MSSGTAGYQGQCYCGKSRIETSAPPEIVTYCHCSSCRRGTGAPVTAWAAFADDAVTFLPDEGGTASSNLGVSRSFCTGCGAPTAHRYDYAPGQVYVGVGLFEKASEMKPSMHAHFASRLTWLKVTDDLEKIEDTSRTQLAAAAGKEQR